MSEDIWTTGEAYGLWEVGQRHRQSGRYPKKQEVFFGSYVTREELLQKIESAKKSALDIEENAGSDYSEMHAWDHVGKAQNVLAWFDLCEAHGLDFKLGDWDKKHHGFVLIENKFLVPPNGTKWRVLNKWTWYRQPRKAEQFITKYVLGKQ